jgi:hypothetical protein
MYVGHNESEMLQTNRKLHQKRLPCYRVSDVEYAPSAFPHVRLCSCFIIKKSFD